MTHTGAMVSSSSDRLLDLLKRVTPPSSPAPAQSAQTEEACAAAFPEDLEGSRELCLLLLEARKPQPGPKWLAGWRALRERFEAERLRRLLLELAEAGNRKMHGWGHEAGDPVMFVARGALWALSDFRDAGTQEFLCATVLDWARSGHGTPALGSAAVWALAAPADEEAASRLLQLKGKIAHKFLRARLEEAIASIATDSGISPDEMSDRQTPDHGLDPGGRRTWDFQGYRVTLRLASDGSVEWEIAGPDGRECKNLPARVRQENGDIWTAVTRETRALKATLSAQRTRLEEAMVSGRSWGAVSWRDTVGAHPLLVSLGRRLVWRIRLPGANDALFGTPLEGGWYDHGGRRLDVPDGASLSIAHPLQMPDGLQRAWQRRVVEQRIVQPFKQVFRETYVVTPAEEEAQYVSARFSGLPVPMHAVYALARTRGWSGPLGQTFFDGAGEGYREFPGENVRAVFRHSVESPVVAVVESVHFETNLAGAGAKRKNWSRTRLQEVPPVPFSEAMRDIDLIVSVAALGTEAQWQEWEAAREAGRVRWPNQRAEYERRLVETSQSRAALLSELLPFLGLAERVSVDGHFAVVQGRRGLYRIHLGTGNIHLEPSGRYLCIVPARARPILYLPFEGEDVKTSEIISKIVLLAHDDAIQDRAILSQLPDTP